MKRIKRFETLFIFLITAFFSAAYAQQDSAPASQQQQLQLQNLLQAAKQAQQQQQQQDAQPIAPPPTPALPTGEISGATNPPVTQAGAPAVQQPATTINPVDTGGDLEDEAFASMAQQQLPMTPAQIRTLRKLFDATQRAATEYPGVPPNPTSSSIPVSLAPGATPPVILLQSGFITSLVFLDSTGAPWPIKAYDLGDPNAYNIQWDTQGNTLLVQAITVSKTANLAVQLKGLNTPVMLTLIPGQASVEYRVDLHVPGWGPNAVPLGSGLPAAASPLLLNILSGIPPQGSKLLQTFPEGYADVWLYRGYLYVRTRARIISPAWLSTMSSSDGTHAYKVQLAPLIIVSLDGKTINLEVQGY